MNLEQLSGTETKSRAKRILGRLGVRLDAYKSHDQKRYRYDFPSEVIKKYNKYLYRIEKLKGVCRYIESEYFIDLKSRTMPNPYIKASIILYLLDSGLILTEVARILSNDHCTIIYYRDKYRGYNNRLFKIIKEDVYKLLREFEAEEGGTNAITK